MDQKLCIVICNSLVPEINQIIKSGSYHDVDVRSFPASCTGTPLNLERIASLTEDGKNLYSKIIFIASSCISNTIDTNKLPKNVEVVRLQQCFDILISKEIIYNYIKKGYYLVTNGWLRNYKHYISEWGFEKGMAKSFFGESMKKILWLDTQLPGDLVPSVEDLSQYMGLPYEIFPIGLSHCENYLSSLISSWRAETERINLNEQIAKISQESAEYSLLFYQLKNLINLTDEQVITKEISTLLDVLFSPAQICFQQYSKGIDNGRICFKQGNQPTTFNATDSFIIEIKHRNEILGIYDILGIRFPQFINQYKAMGQVISQIGGLSIENARKYSELEQIQLELAISEERYKSIMHQSPSVIELYDLEGIQIQVNKAYEELWGFPASLSVNHFNILKSDEVKRTGLLDYVLQAYSGESVRVPVYLFNPTGETEARGQGRERWLSTRIYPIKDTIGKVINITLTHEDVTDIKMAETKLSENIQQFKNLSQSGTEMLNLPSVEGIYDYLTTTFHKQYPDAVILFLTVDKDELNSTLLNIKGISDTLFEKIIKLTGFNFQKKKFKILPLHSKLFRSGKFVSFPGGLVDFSGNEFPAFAAKASEKLLGIKSIYTIGINKDDRLFATIHFFNRSDDPITDNEYIESFVKQAAIVIERKLLEESLKESEEKYRLIAENTSDVIWTLNIETLKFSYISPSVTQLTGFTVEEAIGQSILEALEPNSAKYVMTELPKRIAEFYAGNFSRTTSTNEMQQKCKDGSLIWVEFTTMFKINEGVIADILGITRNINERKQAELEIQEKNKELVHLNTEKDKLFSIIAHDLRNPFSSILGLTEVMIEESETLTKNQLVDFARSLKKTTTSSYNLLENLLDWSRLQRGLFIPKPAIVSLNRLAEEAIFHLSELAVKKKIQIYKHIPDNLFVEADERMIGSVIRNLITNAIKFTHKGGKIKVEAMKSKTEITIKISDNGVGMSGTILSKLFKIDSEKGKPGTEGEESSGLGLLLCKEFVEKNGGNIWAESIEGKGSAFYFTLMEKL